MRFRSLQLWYAPRMALTKTDRVLTITDDAQEAEKLRFSLTAVVVETGAQAGRGVYVKPFQPAGSRKWMYAVCVGRHSEN
jgi:hypothetical protein